MPRQVGVSKNSGAMEKKIEGLRDPGIRGLRERDSRIDKLRDYDR